MSRSRRDLYINDYLDAIGRYPLLSPDEERELLERAREGDKSARERLINCNLRLVVRIASKFLRRGFGWMELISYGNEALMRAVDRFDTTRSGKLSTAVYRYVTFDIYRAIRDERLLIHVPGHVLDFMAYGCYADTVSDEQVIQAKVAYAVSEIDSYAGAGVTWDLYSAKDAAARNRDPYAGLADRKLQDQEEIDAQIDARDQAGRLMRGLVSSYRQIVELAFGMNGQPEACPTELGKAEGLTGSAIRERRYRAIYKMRDMAARLGMEVA